MSRSKVVDEITAKMLAVLKAHYRWPANGHFQVKVGTVIDAATEEDVDFYVYRGSFRRWACRLKYPTVSAKKSWLRNVYGRGIATDLHGRLILEATRLPTMAGEIETEEVYRVVWVEQGRGLEIAPRRGYAAKTCDVVALGDTRSSAIQSARAEVGHRYLQDLARKENRAYANS